MSNDLTKEDRTKTIKTLSFLSLKLDLKFVFSFRSSVVDVDLLGCKCQDLKAARRILGGHLPWPVSSAENKLQLTRATSNF